MKVLKYRQIGLRSGTVEAVVNLLDDPRLRVGNELTMKDHELGPDRWWRIEWVSPTTRKRPATRWNVGGL